MARITELWLENRRGGSALGIAESAPRISVTVDEPVETVTLRFVRDDGRVQKADAATLRLLPWPFTPLLPREGGVLAASGDGGSTWSHPMTVEAGIDQGDWSVDFASPSSGAPAGTLRPAYLLRARFDLESQGLALADLRRVRLYSTAHGIYDLELNGEAVWTDRLAPGWSSYRHRVRYKTSDIRPGLHDGENVLGAWLADGWYRGHIGFDGGVWDAYGTDVALLAQLEATTTSGRIVPVPLEWAWHPSPVTAAGLYEGETFDARRLPRGWSSPDFDASGWEPVATLARSGFPARIEAPTGPPVAETQVLAPVTAERVANGRIRLDFGQNISGVLRIRPRGPRGHEIRMHHAEVLENEELGTRPLRGAISIDTYTCAGVADEVYTPRFTIHGFQYAELENWPGVLRDGDVEAVVVHTAMQRIGWFECSDPDLNRLHANVVWSMRDNFVDLPTDCPQRDERVGWTGDIQVFAPTALRLFAAHGTLAGWLRDLAAEQHDDGHVPQFVPWIECGFPNLPTAAWGDAAVIVPWELYRNDGDRHVLERQYPSMTAWVDLVDGLTGHTGLWNHGFQLGDWLDPTAPPDSPGDSHTDRYLVATAYHVKTSRIVAETARLLGRGEDAARYTAIAERAAAAFRREFVTPSGRIVSDTPTSLAVALVFDLLADADQVARAGERLLHLVAQNGFHISTGFVGTPIICDALVMAGSMDYAYHLLLQHELPSWLYPVSMGATTIWERWDSMLPDGTINPGDMTSFNHYALGAVADFLHRVVAGLTADAPGWSRIRYAPHPGGGLERASARYDTVHGTASIAWSRDGDVLTVDVLVPPGTSGSVELPGSGEVFEVAPGAHRFETTFRASADDPDVPLFGWRRDAVDA